MEERFFHMILRTKENHPRGSVGVRVKKFQTDSYGVSISFAFCNPMDNFSKKDACNKAEGRTRARDAAATTLTREEIGEMGLMEVFEFWKGENQAPHKIRQLLNLNAPKFQRTMRSVVDDVNGVRQCDKAEAH